MSLYPHIFSYKVLSVYPYKFSYKVLSVYIYKFSYKVLSLYPYKFSYKVLSLYPCKFSLAFFQIVMFNICMSKVYCTYTLSSDSGLSGHALNLFSCVPRHSSQFDSALLQTAFSFHSELKKNFLHIFSKSYVTINADSQKCYYSIYANSQKMLLHYLCRFS